MYKLTQHISDVLCQFILTRELEKQNLWNTML